MTHDNWHNEQFMSAKRSEVVTVARSLRDGKMDIVEGALKLSSLKNDVSREQFDEDFMLFLAIASETDHLPIGQVRKQYCPAALERAEKEIKEVESYYRSQVQSACAKLIARFSSAG